MLPFGLLVFVVGSLVIVNAWAVIDAKLAVTAAAREGARAYVEANDAATATEAARAVSEEALRTQGRTRQPRIDVVGQFDRCARVEVHVHYDVPTIVVPFVGGFGSTYTVRSTHSEIVDPFRSGIESGGSCG